MKNTRGHEIVHAHDDGLDPGLPSVSEFRVGMWAVLGATLTVIGSAAGIAACVLFSSHD
ncbi:MAG: hypothetical protein AAB439_01450 [Patescibacteria group bacterium]